MSAETDPNRPRQKVCIIIHTLQNGMTRMIPQVFASKEIAEQSILKTLPNARKLKSSNIWHDLASHGTRVEIKEFEVITEVRILL